MLKKKDVNYKLDKCDINIEQVIITEYRLKTPEKGAYNKSET